MGKSVTIPKAAKLFECSTTTIRWHLSKLDEGMTKKNKSGYVLITEQGMEKLRECIKKEHSPSSPKSPIKNPSVENSSSAPSVPVDKPKASKLPIENLPVEEVPSAIGVPVEQPIGFTWSLYTSVAGTIDALREQLAIKDKQLDKKDRQIESLTELLNQQLQSQVLSRSNQFKTLENTGKKRRWWPWS